MTPAAMISLIKCSSEADAVVREMEPELLSKSLPLRITHCARSVYNHTPASCESFYVFETGKNPLFSASAVVACTARQCWSVPAPEAVIRNSIFREI